MLTLHELVILDVTFPSSWSIAVAHASVYIEPTSRVTGLFHKRVSTGGIHERTSTFRVTILVFPELSVAVYVMV